MLKKIGEPYETIQFEAPSWNDFSYQGYEPGYVYTITRAISARINANYDGFSAEELKKGYKSFLNRPAFVEHHNWDWRKAKGILVDAIYKEAMTPSGMLDAAIYVLAETDAVTFPRLGKAIMDGSIKGTSMGVDIDGSACTYCGHFASQPSDYCVHVARYKGQFLPIRQGSVVKQALVAEYCMGLKFFEDSYVFDPADESAFILQKRYIPF